MYLISVIIPVYNAENYLKKTISSVINQSIGFNNIELILVDDNSNDNSRRIIEDYSSKYSNIKTYFSKNNHGFPGFGRNVGLELATAEYVMFLDNDDEYECDICKNLYGTIVNENVDMVSCGRVFVDDDKNVNDNYSWVGGKEYDNYVLFENDDVLSLDSVTIWNKIFKKEIIDNFELKFLENSSADDFAFSLDYHSHCSNIIHLKKYCGYLWNIRDESLSHDIKVEHVLEVLNAYNLMIAKNKKEINSSKVLFNHMVYLLVDKCSFLNVNYKTFKKVLLEVYNFEKKVDLKVKLNAKVYDLANKFISHKYFYLTFLYFKVLNYFRKRFL